MDLDLKEVNKLIGTTYKKIRKSRKYTQEEVAEKSNVTPEYLSKFENGKYNASIYNIILLCRAINTDPMQLLHYFFIDSTNGIEETLISNIKNLNLEDKKLLLEISNRLKNNK